MLLSVSPTTLQAPATSTYDCPKTMFPITLRVLSLRHCCCLWPRRRSPQLHRLRYIVPQRRRHCMLLVRTTALLALRPRSSMFLFSRVPLLPLVSAPYWTRCHSPYHSHRWSEKCHRCQARALVVSASSNKRTTKDAAPTSHHFKIIVLPYLLWQGNTKRVGTEIWRTREKGVVNSKWGGWLLTLASITAPHHLLHHSTLNILFVNNTPRRFWCCD